VYFPYGPPAAAKRIPRKTVGMINSILHIQFPILYYQAGKKELFSRLIIENGKLNMENDANCARREQKPIVSVIGFDPLTSGAES
jgi:hypothetical protein